MDLFTHVAENFVLYRKGHAAVLDFGPNVPRAAFFSNRHINNQGLIAGITVPIGGNLFMLGLGVFALIRAPAESSDFSSTFPGNPTETLAWGMGINTRGDVLRP